MRYFYTYDSDLPADVGFSIFGRQHILCLIITAVVISIFAALFYGQDDRKRHKTVTAFGIILVSLEVLRIIYLFAVGHFSVYELPLHMCSISGLLCLLHAYTGHDWIGQTLYAVGLPGTVMALVFPDWGMYPAISFINFHGFLFHGLIVCYVICQLLCGGIRPKLRSLWKALLFLCVIIPPIYAFDRIFNTNYFFINVPSPGSPLAWMAGFMGNPGYLLGYAALALAMMTAMYIPPTIISSLLKKSRKQE